MDHRLHLHLDGGTLALCCGGRGSVLPARGGMVNERDEDRPARHGCVSVGDLAAGKATRPAASLRSGQPVHQRAVPAAVADHGVNCSMNRSGNCWDNAAMESFFSSLKTERTTRRTYRTRNDARADVFDYIERFYNPKRRHSTIGYVCPMDC